MNPEEFTAFKRMKSGRNRKVRRLTFSDLITMKSRYLEYVQSGDSIHMARSKAGFYSCPDIEQVMRTFPDYVIATDNRIAERARLQMAWDKQDLYEPIDFMKED